MRDEVTNEGFSFLSLIFLPLMLILGCDIEGITGIIETAAISHCVCQLCCLPFWFCFVKINQSSAPKQMGKEVGFVHQ